MSSIEMTQFLGWIDLTEEDLNTAREYLQSLNEGTVDELGLGGIRDEFSDRFFPGTSTVMSFAKYYTLVPAIYHWVFTQGFSGNRAEKKCDEMEFELRTLLRNNKEIRGNKARIINTPARGYWASVRRLGIFLPRGVSREKYFQLIREVQSNQPMRDDDKNLHGNDNIDLWDPEFVRCFRAKLFDIPDAAGNFTPDIKIALNQAEARYLKQKFTQHQSTSIIAHAFQQESFSPSSFPWDWNIPRNLVDDVRQAEMFSCFSKIATLIYYRMLIELRKSKGLPTTDVDLDAVIETWWDSSADQLQAWKIDDFIARIDELGCKKSDQVFVKQLFDRIQVSPKASTLLSDNKAAKLIQNRERKSKRRLAGGRLLKDWRLPFDERSPVFADPTRIPYLYDFRSGIASRLTEEIFKGLNR